MKPRKPRNTIDGFTPRRDDINQGSIHANDQPGRIERTEIPTTGELHENNPIIRHNKPLLRSDIDSVLDNIDDEEFDQKGRRRNDPEQKQKRRKIIKRVLLSLLMLFIIGAGYVGVKAFMASSRIFGGNMFGIFQSTPLKEDKNGRSNILVYGTAEDDEGGEHSGGNLTDSIMLISINQKQKDAYMFSIPRDFWVKYDNPCSAGYEGKINAVYMCASDNGKNESAGSEAIKSKVSEVTGLDIQYFVHVNNTVLRDSVNAIGGIEVKIESEDPRGIYDPNFDWQCNHQCNMVKYQNGQVVHLDGAHALALARARNAQGGYGLPNGNFDREKNQQKIIKAIQDKALSTGTLTNFGKITGLIDALGANLRTSFQTNEIRTLMNLGKDINGPKIHSISLNNDKKPVVVDGSVGGQSIVRPVAGLYDYSEIKSYLSAEMTSDPVVKEAALIDVYNASGVPGRAGEESEKLKQRGLSVGAVDNLPQGEYSGYKLYKIGDGNEATQKMLEKKYGVQVSEGKPPVYSSMETDFVLVIGTGTDNKTE